MRAPSHTCAKAPMHIERREKIILCVTTRFQGRTLLTKSESAFLCRMTNIAFFYQKYFLSFVFPSPHRIGELVFPRHLFFSNHVFVLKFIRHEPPSLLQQSAFCLCSTSDTSQNVFLMLTCMWEDRGSCHMNENEHCIVDLNWF
jgi:hypothetical protein